MRIWGDFAMIDERILKKLSPITPEERECIKNNRQVNWQVYNEAAIPQVYGAKFLEAGKLIAVRPHTRFAYFPPHTHDYVEMIYMCTGSTRHIMNGQSLTLQTGELLLLGPHTTQEILPAGEGDIAVNFIIRPEFFDRSLAMLGAEDTPLRRFIVDSLCLGKGASRYFHYRVADVLPVQNLVENMLWTLVFGAPNKRQINQTTLGLLFLQLLNYTDRIACQNESQEDMVKLHRYIEENFRRASLSEAAELLGYDIYHLSRQIRKKTGKTFLEILQEKRLLQAAFLLKNTALRISEISVEVGYENTSHFHRLFSARFGCTPKQYRAKTDAFLAK